MSVSDMPVVSIAKLDLTLAPRSWSFAEQRRTEINDHFAVRRKDKPALWNGRVLLLHDYEIDGAVFRGRFLETDFASLLAWSDWGNPDTTMKNCFSMGALKAADGAFLLGVTGDHTATAGRIYFPSGVTDLQSVRGSTVDLEASMWREVAEETGLMPVDLTAEPNWHTLLVGPRIAHIRILHARESADALRSRILTFLASQEQPELADTHIVRGSRDFDPMIQPVDMAFLNSVGIS
jgi:hypothetical protein